MNWERYFTDEMLQQYSYVAVAAAKEATLRESVRDVAFIYEMRAWFLRNGGGEATATPFTVRAITELIGDGWMQLATWGAGGSSESVEASVEELTNIISQLKDTGPTYFLVPTEKGREWVTRHAALLHELHSR